jgi:hypothetical protein
METNRLLSALSYFSILFAGIIFPIIVYFVAEEQAVKVHAKRALLSHLIPFIPMPIVGTIFILGMINSNGEEFVYPILLFIGIGLTILLSFAVLIWNIIKGVKVLQSE